MYSVILRDGSILSEAQEVVEWKNLPLEDIVNVRLHRNGMTYEVEVDGSKVKLLQLKRAVTGVGGPDNVVQRVVGFIWEDKVAVKMVVDEKSGDVKLTLEVKENGKWLRL